MGMRSPQMRLVANARMYSVNPQAAAAWKELFGWLAHASGVELDVDDHILKPTMEMPRKLVERRLDDLAELSHFQTSTRHELLQHPVGPWSLGPVWATVFGFLTCNSTGSDDWFPASAAPARALIVSAKK